MNEKDDLRGVLERGNYTEMAAGEFNSAVAAQLKSYHPHDEIIFVIQRLTGELSFLKISTPSGRLTPPAACYEMYRDAHGPLDFQWLVNNHHQSEQFGQDTDEHRAEVQASLKRAMQDFLGALRLNLKASKAVFDSLASTNFLSRSNISLNRAFASSVWLIARPHFRCHSSLLGQNQ